MARESAPKYLSKFATKQTLWMLMLLEQELWADPPRAFRNGRPVLSCPAVLFEICHCSLSLSLSPVVESSFHSSPWVSPVLTCLQGRQRWRSSWAEGKWGRTCFLVEALTSSYLLGSLPRGLSPSPWTHKYIRADLSVDFFLAVDMFFILYIWRVTIFICVTWPL